MEIKFGLMDTTGKPNNPVKSLTMNDTAYLKLLKKYLHMHTDLSYPHE
jgi:hypothetical protein